MVEMGFMIDKKMVSRLVILMDEMGFMIGEMGFTIRYKWVLRLLIFE